jgi:hypothetical protein
MTVSKSDWLSAASFIDGEGWIGIARGVGYDRKRRKYIRYQCTVRLGITNHEIPDWLKKTFGGSIYFRKSKNPKWSDQYHWVTKVGMIEGFLRGILPYLKLKQKQAELALEFISKKNINDPEYRERMACEMNKLNQKGPVETNTLGPAIPPVKIESEPTGDCKRDVLVTKRTAATA